MTQLDEVLQRLDRMLENRTGQAPLALVQRDLLRESLRSEPSIIPPLLPRERARQKLVQGTPLLHGEPLDPDAGFCRDLFGRLLRVLQRHEKHAEAANSLNAAAAAGQLSFDRALGEALAGHDDHLAELAGWAGVPHDVLASVLQLVVRPALTAVAAAYRPLLAASDSWVRGFCPVCGAWPGLAELRTPVQQRHLRCLRCATDWAALRPCCPYCGNDDQESLGYLQGERELRFRVEVCERCKSYVKSVKALEPNSAASLLLDDLDSVHLDLAAIEAGYSRPTRTGFRLELGEHEPDEALDDLLERD